MVRSCLLARCEMRGARQRVAPSSMAERSAVNCMPLSVVYTRCRRATHAHLPVRLRAGLAGLLEQPNGFELALFGEILACCHGSLALDLLSTDAVSTKSGIAHPDPGSSTLSLFGIQDCCTHSNVARTKSSPCRRTCRLRRKHEAPPIVAS